MKKNGGLFRLLKGHFWTVALLSSLIIFLRVSYSFVPLFVQALLKLLENPGLAITDVNLPTFVLNFLNTATTTMQGVLFIALSFIIWQLTRFVIMTFEKTMNGKLQEKIALQLRVDLFDHIQSLSYHYHNNSDTGDLIQRVTSDVETSTNFIVVQFMQAIGLVFTLLSGAFQMYFINPIFMWISLITIPIYATGSIIYFRNIRERYNEIEEKEAAMMTVIQENVNNTKIVKAFANENYEIEKMDEKNTDYSKTKIGVNKLVAFYWGTMDFLALSQYLVITLIGVYFASKDLLAIDDIAAALMVVGLLIWPVRGLGRLINDYSMASVSINRINEILTQPSEFTINGTHKPEIHGAIVFDKVSFRFPESNDYLLRNVSFTIDKGETVAFVGRTGSGKTTIINLLMRMYEYEGSIKLDGIELNTIEKHYLRNNMGTVLQHPFLYSRTIRDNISITSRDKEMYKIEEASRIATIDKDIRGFTKGYETMVGERGATLSGGQKQRVAIARVLISDKPILIFDDALSAVDNKTDLLIRQALADKDHQSTNLIITHRITTAKEADKIIVLDNHEIEAIGTHKTLYKKPGLYKKLWEIQGNLEEQFLALIKEDQA